jgi:hypothetical protein
MGVQHTFGGVSRVAFPIGAGLLMDSFGVGVPFWVSALLVLVTLPLARTLALVPPTGQLPSPARAIARADITAEFPADVTGKG